MRTPRFFALVVSRPAIKPPPRFSIMGLRIRFRVAADIAAPHLTHPATPSRPTSPTDRPAPQTPSRRPSPPRTPSHGEWGHALWLPTGEWGTFRTLPPAPPSPARTQAR